MKQLIYLFISVTTSLFGILLVQDITYAQTPTTSTTNVVSSVDEIIIPEQILMNVQMKHQGFAITAAVHSTFNNQPAVKVIADQDDVSGGANTLIIHFDKNWKVLDTTNVTPPPAPTPQTKLQKPEAKNPQEVKPRQKPPEQIKKPEDSAEIRHDPISDKPEKPEEEPSDEPGYRPLPNNPSD